MLKFKLTREERKIEKDIEDGKYVPVTDKKILQAMARAIAARKRDMTLTIRVNQGDINLIKKMAKRKGIHYQTYISEVIHHVAQTL